MQKEPIAASFFVAECPMLHGNFVLDDALRRVDLRGRALQEQPEIAGGGAPRHRHDRCAKALSASPDCRVMLWPPAEAHYLIDKPVCIGHHRVF